VGLPPDLVEKLRQTGIRIDREGELVHEGEPVRHHGLRAALFRWLDRLPDGGRHILRLDSERFAYVDVDDTPLVARAARVAAGGQVLLALSDGSEEPLDPATLTMDGAGILRCLVRAGRLEARLTTAAAATLADLITEDGAGGATLVLVGARYPIRPR
jgi:hypothetical protein